MMTALVQVLLFALPWGLRRRALSLLFGYDISPSAHIGFSIVRVKACRLGDGARIGHLTMVKGLELLQIDAHGILGDLNWVTGLSLDNRRHFLHEASRAPSLIIGQHAAVTNRHLLDCTDRVTIGAFSTLGGFWTQILTHAVDLRTSRQSCQPVVVGAYCFVGTGSVLLKGAVLPDRSVLGAGSVLTKAMSEPGMLYSGVPAVPVRVLGIEGGYFTRPVGFVD